VTQPPETCPTCGADVPAGAKACPECGADEQTGWSEEAYASHLNLPDDSFQYDEFAEREFGGKKIVPYGINWFWWVVAVLLLALIAVGFLKFFR
jgi:hypothetical protein